MTAHRGPWEGGAMVVESTGFDSVPDVMTGGGVAAGRSAADSLLAGRES